MTEELKKNSILEKIEITEAVSEGKSMARVDGMVVFIEGGVPGDIADLKIRKLKSKYAEANVIRVHQPSPHRLTPFCEHFGTCGGCVWQHMDYEMQLLYKQKQVEDAMHHIGKVEIPSILPIIRSSKTQFYRNRLDFTFSNRRWLTKEENDIVKNAEGEQVRKWESEKTATPHSHAFSPTHSPTFSSLALGYHVPKRFDKILDVNKCWLQDDLSNKIRNTVKEIAIRNQFSFFDQITQEGFLRNLVIRNTTTGEWMVIAVFKEDLKNERELLLNELSEKIPQITSLLYIINPKRNDTFSDLDVHLFKGNDHITERMPLSDNEADGFLKFKISAKSFYQTNSEQAYYLYKTARDLAALTGNELVYDLYTGTGTIANFVSRDAKRVIGIDYINDAIEDAKENSKANSVANTEFFAGDLKDTFTNEFTLQHGRPDVVITDPPRAGMHADVVKRLLEIRPDCIVYVSCNPATQARDINLLSEKYNIVAAQPVDMFPHTSHVENVMLLTAMD